MSSTLGLSRSLSASGVFRICGRWSLALVACLLSSPAGAVTIEMVTVGNPGNKGDRRVGANTFGKGVVDYSYQIGKYDVTIGQYTAFLNAVDPTGIGIYNSSIENDSNIAGISYNAAAAAGSKYAVMSPAGYVPTSGVTAANRPVTYVTWYNAARFANWMTNGQGGPGTTETGAYDLATAAPGVAPAKTPGAAFYIPNENEWYKAAYYSPNYGGVDVPGYYAYATQSDTAPGNTVGSTANQANHFTFAAGFSVTQSGGYELDQNYLTDVGAFSGSGSFYGTFDQSGNVYQWNDLDGAAGSSRGVRGGYWSGDDPNFLSSSVGFSLNASIKGFSIGFRLASPVSGPSGVPEIDPATGGSALSLVAGVLAMIEQRRRRATLVA